MKYEMIFGDYKFANCTCEIAMQSDYGEVIEMTLTPPVVVPEGWRMIAMRRIIQEPKRWTLEDKLAGRLPEVGSMILFINDMKQVEFAGTDGGNYFWYFKRDSGAFGSAYFNCFKPIETTEEKAQRERNEWAKNASQFIDDELDCVNIVGEHVMRRFYNAMLSGELPVPVKE